MLMHRVIAMLNDDDRVTENICLRSGPQTFKSICRKVLCSINNLVQNFEENAGGYGPHVDFSPSKTFCGLREFVGEDSTMGMIQTADYKNVNKVATFLGGFGFLLLRIG